MNKKYVVQRLDEKTNEWRDMVSFDSSTNCKNFYNCMVTRYNNRRFRIITRKTIECVLVSNEKGDSTIEAKDFI